MAEREREPTQQVAFRLPVSLLERLDAYAQEIEAEHPGMSLNRSDVARMLLVRALDDQRARAGGRPKRGR